MSATKTTKAMVNPAGAWRTQFTASLTIVLVLAVGTLTAIEVHRWTTGDSDAGAQLLAEMLIFASALTGSIGGFAFSAFAGGALSHLFTDPVQSVQILAMCSIAIQGYSVARLWRSIQWRLLIPFVAGGAVTAPIAVQWLLRLSPGAFSLALGAFLVAYGIYMLVRRARTPVRGNVGIDLVIGALGGITGGLAAFPGAFAVPWCSLRGYDKATARGICQPYILLMQIIVLSCMHSRAVSLDLNTAMIAYLAVALLAAHLGIAVFRALTNRQFCLIIHGLLIVSGVSLVLKGL
jgi:uncharacterized membrane protein YfcA